MRTQATLPLGTRTTRKLEQAIEALWLLAFAIVPVIMVSPTFMYDPIDLPKVTLFRSLTGLMAILFVTKLVMAGQWRPMVSASGLGMLLAWVRRAPSRWIVVAALAFLIANFISAAVSIVPKASLWGRMPIADGYSAYNTLSLIVFFLILAGNARTLEQSLRIMSAIVVAGITAAVYGIFQHSGISLFNLVTPGARITSTLGNPIFLGALLSFSILATTALAVVRERFILSNGYFLLFTVLLSIQTYALLLTQSRGPWVGLAAGTVLFIALSSVALGRKVTSSAISLTMLSWVVAISITIISGSQASEAVQSRVDTLGEVSTALTPRTEIWSATLDLISTRPVPLASPSDLRPLRYLIGYGPESLGYVYPLRVLQEVESRPENDVPTQAHNFYLHEMVELGPLGLLAFLCVLGIFGLTTMRILLTRPPELSPTHLIIGVGLLASISAWAVQSFVGIPRISDMIFLWGLLGMAVALPGLVGDPPLRPDRSASRTKSKAGLSLPTSTNPVGLLGWVIIASVVLIFGALIVLQDVQNMIAARTAARGVIFAASGDAAKGTSLLDEAISLSPNATMYYMQNARVLGELAERTKDRQAQLLHWTKAINLLEQALEVDQMNREAVLLAGETALQLGLLGQTDRSLEALAYYERYASLAPRRWEAHFALGKARYEFGLWDQALEALGEASRLNVYANNEQLHIGQLRTAIYEAQAN
jgi:O-antigen ligase